MATNARNVIHDLDERRARVELAALYRLFHHYGWTDTIETHLSCRVPGTTDQYLINPYGLLFDEITASSLIRVDFDGRVLEGDHPFNEAGHLIHTAVLRARPDIEIVLHSHTRAGMAVSAMDTGLLPLTQQACEVMGLLTYHDYQMAYARPELECELLGRDMARPALAMIMRNHGLLACGRTAAEAFHLHMLLENACKVQVDVLQAGAGYVVPPQQAIDDLSGYYLKAEPQEYERQWAAMMRLVRRHHPGFED
jgi:ribulose-5-phosphate 4-epimerase/fuculose-1-phosphate aldolase